MATAIIEDYGNTASAWLGYSSTNPPSTLQENIEIGSTTYRLQLSLEAQNLHPRMSCFKGGSTFQPYAVLKLLSNDTCLGKTECNAPEGSFIKWTQTVYYPDYEIGSQPYVQVSIYNSGAKQESHELNDEEQTMLGQCNFNMFEVLEKSKEAGEGLTISLDHGRGSITMFAHTSQNSSYILQDSVKSHVMSTNNHHHHRRRLLLQFRALNVKNIEGGTFALGLGRSDPFITLSKKYSNPETGRTRWQRIYKSPVIMNHTNPLWEEFHIHLDDLCDDDLNRPLLVELWDYQSSGNHRLMGCVEASPNVFIARRSRIGNADKTQSLIFYPSDDSRAKVYTRYDVMGELIVLQAKLF